MASCGKILFSQIYFVIFSDLVLDFNPDDITLFGSLNILMIDLDGVNSLFKVGSVALNFNLVADF